MAKKFIQAINADIKKRGTEGVCTGDKFGSESCPAGSRRYNLAKLFRRLAHERDMRITTKEERNK